MNEDVKKHYKGLYEKHGMAPEAVQYISKDSQYRRFDVLAQIDPEMKSLVDLGCGLGDMYDFLKGQNKNVKFLGLDFVNEFVEAATERFKQDENASFKCFDGLKDEFPKGYDYYALSGVFNNKVENNEEFMFSTITKMFAACEKGIAFNAMSTYVDYFDEHLFYIDPLKVFDYCKKHLSRKVVLRHDYLVKDNSIPFEFTIYLYK